MIGTNTNSVELVYWISQIIASIGIVAALAVTLAQLRELKTSLHRTQFDQNTQQIDRLNDLLLQHPRLVDRLATTPGPAGSLDRELMMFAEAILDQLDIILLRQSKFGRSSNTFDLPDLEIWMADMFRELPMLSFVISKRKDWYSRKLQQIGGDPEPDSALSPLDS